MQGNTQHDESMREPSPDRSDETDSDGGLPLTRRGLLQAAAAAGVLPSLSGLEAHTTWGATGTVADVQYPTRSGSGARPTYADLTGVETVTVDTGEVRVRIAVTLPIQTLLDQVW